MEEREDGPLTPLEKDFGLTKGSAVCGALVNFVPGTPPSWGLFGWRWGQRHTDVGV